MHIICYRIVDQQLEKKMEQSPQYQKQREQSVKKILSQRINRIIKHSQKREENQQRKLSSVCQIFYNKLFQQMEYCYIKLYEDQVKYNRISINTALKILIDQFKQVSHWIWKEILMYEQCQKQHEKEKIVNNNIVICHRCKKLIIANDIQEQKEQIQAEWFFDPYRFYDPHLITSQQQYEQQISKQIKLSTNQKTINDQLHTLKQRLTQRTYQMTCLLNQLVKYSQKNNIFKMIQGQNRKDENLASFQGCYQGVIELIEEKLMEVIRRIRIRGGGKMDVGVQVGRMYHQLEKFQEEKERSEKRAEQKNKQCENLKKNQILLQEKISAMSLQLEEGRFQSLQNQRLNEQIKIQLKNEKQVNNKMRRRLSEKEREVEGLTYHMRSMKLKWEKDREGFEEINKLGKKQLRKISKQKIKVRNTERYSSININIDKLSKINDGQSCIDIDEQDQTLQLNSNIKHKDIDEQGDNFNRQNLLNEEPWNAQNINIGKKLKNRMKEELQQQQKISKWDDDYEKIQIIESIQPMIKKQNEEIQLRQQRNQEKSLYYSSSINTVKMVDNKKLNTNNLSTEPTLELIRKLKNDENTITNYIISKPVIKAKLGRVSAPILQSGAKISQLQMVNQLEMQRRKQSQDSQLSGQYRQFDNRQDHLKVIENYREFCRGSLNKIGRCRTTKNTQINLKLDRNQIIHDKRAESLIFQRSDYKTTNTLSLSTNIKTSDISQNQLQFPHLFDINDVKNLYLSIQGSITYQKEKKRRISHSSLILKPHELKFVNTVLAVMVSMHTCNPVWYEAMRELLLFPYEAIVSQQNYIVIRKSVYNQIKIRDALIRILAIHKICRNETKNCIHIRKFIKKLQSIIGIQKQKEIPMPIICQQRENRGKDN